MIEWVDDDHDIKNPKWWPQRCFQNDSRTSSGYSRAAFETQLRAVQHSWSKLRRRGKIASSMCFGSTRSRIGRPRPGRYCRGLGAALVSPVLLTVVLFRLTFLPNMTVRVPVARRLALRVAGVEYGTSCSCGRKGTNAMPCACGLGYVAARRFRAGWVLVVLPSSQTKCHCCCTTTTNIRTILSHDFTS